MKNRPCLFCNPGKDCPDCLQRKLLKRKSKIHSHIWWLFEKKKTIQDEKRIVGWWDMMRSALEEKSEINKRLGRKDYGGPQLLMF